MAGKRRFSGNYCDIKARDFIVLTRGSQTLFEPHRMPPDRGDKILNALFKADILKVLDISENKELILQLMTTKKDNEHLIDAEAVGAFITALRPIPWNFSKITNPKKHKKPEKLDPRMAFWTGKDRPEITEPTYDQEIDHINEEYEYYGYEG